MLLSIVKVRVDMLFCVNFDYRLNDLLCRDRLSFSIIVVELKCMNLILSSPDVELPLVLDCEDFFDIYEGNLD